MWRNSEPVNYGAVDDQPLNRLIAERLGYTCVVTTQGYSLLDPNNDYVCPDPGYNNHADTEDRAWLKLCPQFTNDAELRQSLVDHMTACELPKSIIGSIDPRWYTFGMDYRWCDPNRLWFVGWRNTSDNYLTRLGSANPSLSRAICECYLLYTDALAKANQ